MNPLSIAFFIAFRPTVCGYKARRLPPQFALMITTFVGLAAVNALDLRAPRGQAAPEAAAPVGHPMADEDWRRRVAHHGGRYSSREPLSRARTLISPDRARRRSR